ncbi:MAG: methionine adenosyltransferase domain-containing protein, partial [Bacteroidales bacterium]
IAEQISKTVDLRPYAIIQRFGLKNPIFKATASYGHFGRDVYKKEVEVYYQDENTKVKKQGKTEHYFKTIEFFGWEKLDLVSTFKKTFKIA